MERVLPIASPPKRVDLIHRIDQAGAATRSLGDPLFDTSTSQGRLLVTMLAAIAEFERELIRERTGEGRARALAAGVRFGRKPKLSDFQRKEALSRRGNGETLAQIARSYAVSVSRSRGCSGGRHGEEEAPAARAGFARTGRAGVKTSNSEKGQT